MADASLPSERVESQDVIHENTTAAADQAHGRNHDDVEDEETATESDSYIEKTTRHSDWGDGMPPSSLAGEVASRRKRVTRGGSITVKVLIDEGILEPGDGVLSVEYKGMVSTADLLEDGKIRVDVDGESMTFDSPSAFSIYLKRLVNPTRKADDGWKSVKYKGTLLEKFKVELAKQSLQGYGDEGEKRQKVQKRVEQSPVRAPRVRRGVYDCVGADSSEYTVELQGYRSGEQPFTLRVSPCAEAVIDFHSHLCYDEVMGLLMGTISDGTVTVRRAVPIAVKNEGQVDRVHMDADEMEAQIKGDDLQCVGSYHSHPDFAPLPTIIDTVSFLKDASQQRGMLRVEAIVSPYDPSNEEAAAPITWFHVASPDGAEIPDGVNPARMGCVPYRLRYSETVDGSDSSLQKIVEDLAKRYAPADNRVNIDGLWKKTEDGEGILRIEKIIESFQSKLKKAGSQLLDGKLNSFVMYKLEVLVRAVWSVYGRKDVPKQIEEEPKKEISAHHDDDEPISDDNES